MTTRFLLIRHATCARMDSVLFGRAVDVALSAHGARQAIAVATHLAAQEPDLLLRASPRRRALQTACAVSVTTHAVVQLAQDVDEIDFGHWSGQYFHSLAQDPDWRRWNEHRDVALTPAGDSIAKVQTRAGKYLDCLHAAFPTRTIAIVTHAEVIRALLLRIWRRPATDYESIPINPGSITTLACRQGNYTVQRVNEQAAP